MVKSFNSKSLKEHGRFEDDMKDWMDDLVKISFKETRQLTLRPVTPMIMMARHWPQSLTSGKPCPPIWCPKFNSETQKFDLDLTCHLHDDFGDRWKAQKVIIFGAIVREWQEDGKKNPVGLIVLPGSTSVALVQIVGINKYDISDPDKGCDLSVVNAKDAPPANQWQIQRTDRTPLSEEERAYKVPDLDRLSPDFGDERFLAQFSKEMKRKLANFGYYVSSKENGEEGWNGYKKDVNGQPYTDFSELAALVGDGKQGGGGGGGGGGGNAKGADLFKRREEAATPKLKRHHDIVDEEEEPAPAKKVKPKAPVDEDVDDDDGDDDEEDAPPPPKKAKPAPVVDDDEDEPAPVKKAKNKDDDAEPPFDPDEDEKPVKSAKSKQPGPPSGSEEWSETFDIAWKKGDEGDDVPKCFGVFAGAKKCKACPVKKACMAADSE